MGPEKLQKERRTQEPERDHRKYCRREEGYQRAEKLCAQRNAIVREEKVAECEEDRFRRGHNKDQQLPSRAVCCKVGPA